MTPSLLPNGKTRPAHGKPPKQASGMKHRPSSSIPYATNSLKARKKGKRKKLRSMKALKKLVWHHFSIFVRTSVADSNGYVTCVTCLSVHLWNSGEIHAGHWIHDRLDYDSRNIHPQCVKCNYHWNTGVNIAYAVFMARTYGVEVMDELRLLSHTHGNRYTRDELDELLAKYKAINAASPLLAKESR
jgi:hypothetical protein